MIDIVVDANIFVSLFDPSENAFCAEATTFAAEVSKRADRICAPAILLWEVGCAANHQVKHPLGQAFNGPKTSIHLVDVTESLFETTWMAERISIRALDWIYVSVAKALGAPLITRDKQLLTNGPSLGIVTQSITDYMTA